MFALLVSLSPFAGADEPGYGVTGMAVAKLAGGVKAPAPAEGFYKTMGGPLSLPSCSSFVALHFAGSLFLFSLCASQCVNSGTAACMHPTR